MKKRFFKYLVLFSAFVLQSCNDSFSPVGEFEDGYSMYCILNSAEDVQKVYIFRNFLPDDLNPENYNQNRTIGNAKVRLSDGSNNFIFTDTTLFVDSLGYNISYYQINNFSPGNSLLKLTADIPGYKSLTGEIEINAVDFDFYHRTKRDIEYNTFNPYRVRFDKEISFEFLPVFLINYITIENGDTAKYSKEVPLYYYNDGGLFLSKYPDFETRMFVDYETDVIEQTFKIIASEHKSKNIKIVDADIYIIQTSYPLNVYYKAAKTARDGFSIKLQEPEISNITNGRGLFGFKKITSLKVKFAASWGPIFSQLGLYF